MKLITLIMSTPSGDRAEYTLLCCPRLPKTYLMDLYALYVGKEQEVVLPEEVQSLTSLKVAEILDPSGWLECIQWSRFRREGEERKCLEVCVSRPLKSQVYYAVGMKGNVLMNADESIQVHPSTVEILCGESKTSCLRPRAVWVDVGKSNKK